MHVEIDPENYSFTPAKKQTDYYDNNIAFCTFIGLSY